jgi:ubiquinone/menaquinone biosynthesis C-methylase UbiE
MESGNHIMVEAWNTVLYDKFCRFRHLIADGLSRQSDAALDQSDIAAGNRVLDLGSGFGDCTRRIAERVGPKGAVVGIDCAENFVRLAQAEVPEQFAANVEFVVDDAAVADLRGPYDHAFSRFGTMFFALPGAAMRNVRSALKPGGTFTQIVWRKRQDNPWLYEAELRVKEIVPVVSHQDTDQVHCGPGPFSMADADMVSSMLCDAGFDRIAFERFDCDICIGRDMDDAIDFAMALGPAGEIIRLAGEEGQKRKPQVVTALRQVFTRFQRPNGIWAPSSTWIVTARNPF